MARRPPLLLLFASRDVVCASVLNVIKTVGYELKMLRLAVWLLLGYKHARSSCYYMVLERK
jgi:hypothetical protein